jgi:hypothetical protein
VLRGTGNLVGPCIATTGAAVCPAPYVALPLSLHDGTTIDTRGCGDCTCDDPGNATCACGATGECQVSLFAAGQCLVPALLGLPLDATCHRLLTLTATSGAVSLVGPHLTVPGSCTGTRAATGSVVPDPAGQLTVCCLP